jgi:hypothetical protein
VAILLATTAASAAASAIIVWAGIAPAFAGAVMVVDNVGRRPTHSATTVAAVSSTAPPHRRHPPLPWPPPQPSPRDRPPLTAA